MKINKFYQGAHPDIVDRNQTWQSSDEKLCFQYLVDIIPFGVWYPPLVQKQGVSPHLCTVLIFIKTKEG